MWQPFNGLQVYPGGVPQGQVDSSLFEDIPPALCKKGGAIMRIGCDDEGYPAPDEKKREKRPKDAVYGKDIARAEEKVLRGHYKGLDFVSMSDVLNLAEQLDPHQALHGLERDRAAAAAGPALPCQRV